MIEEACNEYVLVLRDETQKEIDGYAIPGAGRTKPHSGIIHAIGSLVKDKNIASGKGRKCLFHADVGFEINYEEVVYLVLADREIIALP